MSKSVIFLVDDNAAHRSLVKRAISRAKITHPISEAGSLVDARRHLFSKDAHRAEVALIILDLNLCDGRSTALMAEIRGSSAHEKMPILVLSTSSLEADVRESYESGASCYLTKADDITVFSSDIAAAVRFLLR